MSFEPLEFTQLNSWAYKTFSYFSSDLKNPIALIWNLSISILHHNKTDTTGPIQPNKFILSLIKGRGKAIADKNLIHLELLVFEKK